MTRHLPSRQGFTLIELMIAVVILGILATIAVAGSRRAIHMSYEAVLKSDLRNLATAQEAYFVENDRYTRRVRDLEFTPSADVIVRMRGNRRGFSARLEHRKRRPERHFCAIFQGTVRPHRPATEPGVITCQTR